MTSCAIAMIVHITRFRMILTDSVSCKGGRERRVMKANDTALKESIAYRTAILHFLQNYSIGDWIYPRVVHDALDLDIKVVYQVLKSLEADSIVEQYLELHCPTCHRFSGLFYKTIGDIPEEISCPSCGEKITSLLFSTRPI